MKIMIILFAIVFSLGIAWFIPNPFDKETVNEHALHNLHVIDELQILDVYSSYGSFKGIAVGPHLILTVAHGAELAGDMTINHYKVSKLWSDDEADLALLQTDETFYTYSELVADYPFYRVDGRELGPGDSGTALVNQNDAVCYLLQGYDHGCKLYISFS